MISRAKKPASSAFPLLISLLALLSAMLIAMQPTDARPLSLTADAEPDFFAADQSPGYITKEGEPLADEQSI